MTALMFPGQGIQYKGMGRDLFDYFPDLIKEIDSILGYSIKQLCIEDPYQQLALTEYSQPAVFVVNELNYLFFKEHSTDHHSISYALGHSLGIYNAISLANFLPFQDILRIVKKRGELMGKVKNGGMTAVINYPVDKLNLILQQEPFSRLVIANYNSPEQVVISGSSADLDSIHIYFRELNIKYIPLSVSGAFHSPTLSVITDEFRTFLQNFSFMPPKVKVISNVDNKVLCADSIVNDLTLHLYQPVLWQQNLEVLLSENITPLEVSNRNILMPLYLTTKRYYKANSLPSEDDSFDQKHVYSLPNLGTKLFDDHEINQNKVMPGAIIFSLIYCAEQKFYNNISNISWHCPVLYENYIKKNNNLKFIVNKNIIRLSYIQEGQDDKHYMSASFANQQLNIPTNKAYLFVEMLKNNVKDYISGTTLYSFFSKHNICYGSLFQNIYGVAHLRNQHGFIGCLNFKQLFKSNLNCLELTTVIIDNIFQIVMSYFYTNLKEVDDSLYIPMHIEQAQFYSNNLINNEIVFVFLQPVISNQYGKYNYCFNLNVVDELGNALLDLNKFIIRKVVTADKSNIGAFETKQFTKQDLSANLFLYSYEWVDLEFYKEDNHYLSNTSNLFIIINGVNSSNNYKINDDDIIINITTQLSEIDMYFEVFVNIQKFMMKNLSSKIGIYIISHTMNYKYISPIVSLLKSIKLENSYLTCKVIYASNPNLAINKELFLQLFANEFLEVRVLSEMPHKYQVRQPKILDIEQLPHNELSLIRDSCVYWIIGGLGGIGTKLATFYATNENCTVVLSGRSDLNEVIQTKLQALNSGCKGKILYKQMDITDSDSVTNTYECLKSKYGMVKGIVHAAGVLHDSLFIKKNMENIRTVFAPKYLGTLNLHKAIGGDKIDYLILFSSISACLGHIGQSDYAAANAYLDAFAQYRNGLAIKNEVYGRTLSINWPYWDVKGGMQMEQKMIDGLKKHGIYPLSSDLGINIFKTIVENALENTIVLYGDNRRFGQLLI